jgi:hypothetical protein
MNYKILMDGAIPGHNAGDIIDLSESDGNSLSQWGIVEIIYNKPPAATAPVPEPAKEVEAPVPDKVEAATATAATESGSADPKAKAAK